MASPEAKPEAEETPARMRRGRASTQQLGKHLVSVSWDEAIPRSAPPALARAQEELNEALRRLQRQTGLLADRLTPILQADIRETPPSERDSASAAPRPPDPTSPLGLWLSEILSAVMNVEQALTALIERMEL